MPLYECVDQHWLLFVVNVQGRKFSVFDSLLRKEATAQATLIECAVSTITLLCPFRTLDGVHSCLLLPMNSKECHIFFLVEAARVC